MTECDNNEKSCFIPESIIELEPFIHQVGGRSAILVLGDYICKPVNERELAFYESIDQSTSPLKPFLPHFNGVISVNFAESNDGYLMITTKSSSFQDFTSGFIHANDATTSHQTNSSNSCVLRSPNSPYQKFVTKYRIKLFRPLSSHRREIIIESHEQDVEQNNVSLDLECSKKQLEHFILNNSTTNHNFERSVSTIVSPPSSHTSTNLSRSRSTSISIPNFEDGNFFNQTDLTSLFDNQLFVNEAGQNGYSPNHHHHHKCNSPQLSRQSSVQSSPSKKAIYTKSTTKHNPWVLKAFSSLSEFNDSMKEQSIYLFYT